jgi:hypothetical protein
MIDPNWPCYSIITYLSKHNPLISMQLETNVQLICLNFFISSQFMSYLTISNLDAHIMSIIYDVVRLLVFFYIYSFHLIRKNNQ